MVVVNIRGIQVDFPFEPYQIQKDYMEKVIECLSNETNGVLESPTGTGKTLSLLCSSLAWLQTKKAQSQVHFQQSSCSGLMESGGELLNSLKTELEEAAGKMASGRAFLGLPTIIYASRTHSQLSQAVQELKRTNYRHMKASVLGSRDQLCIHPDILAEEDRGLRVQMCRMKVSTRSCHFNNRVERMKDDPRIADVAIIDIEDMVKLGECHKFCPYYMTKELKQRSDIIFSPYNYLLDPLARKGLGVELGNNVIILDEAHNVEKICEDSASIVVKTTDITLAIEETTAVMKILSEGPMGFEEYPKDFLPDELCQLKQTFLDFEEQMDAIKINNVSEGVNFPGDYIFGLLEKANITQSSASAVRALIDKVVQYLSTVSEGPFARKGKGLQLFLDFLNVVFAKNTEEFKQKIKKCYRVHLTIENQNNKKPSTWLSKSVSKTTECRVLSYWCFSPGFGMNLIMGCGIRSLILTSGTLAPLKPLISELELAVSVELENPHIIGERQIFVKVVPCGPDMEPLNSNYQNRENPKYVSSLGRAILNLSRIIPSGLLIFFSSYPVMQKCKNAWENEGIWASIDSQKKIFVEPRDKNSFNSAMTEYYEKVADPKLKGAIFMGVCRGKVSEGLDFADANGRAVIITGLPYPPLKDPRVILKRQYLDNCNASDKQFLRGEEWYSLEASRAVNQAVGRVIRHKNDYGAILLLDTRFSSERIRQQMSRWLRDHVRVARNFGQIIGELSRFFRNVQSGLPPPQPKPKISELPSPEKGPYRNSYSNFDFGSTQNSTSQLSHPVLMPDSSNFTPKYSSPFAEVDLNPNGSVTINKRINNEVSVNAPKRKKIVLIPNKSKLEESVSPNTTAAEYMSMVKKTLDTQSFQEFVMAVQTYKNQSDFEELTYMLNKIFLKKASATFIIKGLEPYIHQRHQDEFESYWQKMR